MRGGQAALARDVVAAVGAGGGLQREVAPVAGGGAGGALGRAALLAAPRQLAPAAGRVRQAQQAVVVVGTLPVRVWFQKFKCKYLE